MPDYSIRAAIRSFVTAVIVNAAGLAVELLANAVWAWVALGLMLAADVALGAYLWIETLEPITEEKPSAARDAYERARRRRTR
jgi:hypothetical protein